jgi:hypothetical protein
VRLARRAGPDQVEVLQAHWRVQSVALDEWERVPLLPLDVDAHHIETRAMKAHRRAASTAE